MREDGEDKKQGSLSIMQVEGDAEESVQEKEKGRSVGFLRGDDRIAQDVRDIIYRKIDI